MLGSLEHVDLTTPRFLVSRSNMKLFYLIILPPIIISVSEPNGSMARHQVFGRSSYRYSLGYHLMYAPSLLLKVNTGKV